MLDFFELRGAVLVAIVAVCLAGGHVCGEILMVPCQVSAGPDDGYELNDDWGHIIDNTILLIGTHRNDWSVPFPITGMRFTNVGVPRSAHIIDARLKVRSTEYATTGRVYGTIYAEAADNPADFASRKIYAAAKTISSVPWNQLSDWATSTWYTSDDISAVIQEVIDRDGWQSGNALVLLYSTSRKSPYCRWFAAFEAAPAYAPIIEVTYEYYEISGQVTGRSGEPVAGVVISTANDIEPAVTNSEGYYAVRVPPGWSGTITPNHPDWTFTPADRTYNSLSSDLPGQDFNAFQPIISGCIKDRDGANLEGVLVASGDGAASDTTDSGGLYELAVPYNWSGTVTPAKNGWSFTPQQRSYANLISDEAGQDYTAVQPRISGYVKTIGGLPMVNVQVSADNGGGSDTTDTNGYYELIVPYNWSGTLTPTLTDWTFNPASRTYSNVTADLVEQNYTGLPPLQISGFVRTAGGIPMENVQVSADSGGASDVTDANGYYQLTVLYNWSGTVAPSLAGWGFTPAMRTYNGIVADQLNQDYTIFQPLISGHVIGANGFGAEAIAISADNGGGADTTDADGFYAITVPYGWSGTVTPNRPTDCGLNPEYRSYNNVVADQNNQDYALFQPIICGHITDINGLGIGGISLAADNSGGSDTSDANGLYQIAVPYGWSGTVTPNRPPEYAVVPEYRTYANVIADQDGQDYTVFQPQIAGCITEPNGQPKAGIAVSTDDQIDSDLTDSNGFYSLTFPYNWSGTVTPELAGWKFDPAKRTYSEIVADRPNQNYIVHIPQTFVLRADGTGDYPTIQAAINAALNGDTIILEDGTYTGSGNRNLDFKGKAIKVCSLNGPEVTIIDCQESSRGCNFDSGEGPDTILSGVTIKNGKTTYNAGGCIYCYGGSPTIENCIITASKCIVRNYSMEGGPAYGGGISCRGGSDTIIVGCTISNNLVQGGNATSLEGVDWPFAGGTGYGGGVYSDASSTPTIIDCLFSGNKATGGTGYPGSGYPGWPCAGAGGHAYGGGIYTGSTVPVIIERCVFLGNAALGGDSSYGMYCGSIGNAGNGLGGGIHSSQGSAVLRNCSVVANTAHSGNGPSIYAEGVGYGGGLYGTIEITGCTFVGNSAEHRGGGVYGNSNVSTSIIWSNSAPSGAQIYGNPSVSYSDVKNGFAGQGNIDANPLLEGPVDGIYHLSQDSPCINAGDPNYVADTNELDIDGQTRVNGGRTDMGADEFFSPTPFVVLSAAEFDFTAWIDGNQPSPQVLLISNVGPNDMPWDITKDYSWLSVEPNSGVCPAGGAQQVALRVDANGLQGGNHTCTLNIAAPNASNSPLTVLANLRVYGPVISLSSSDIDFLSAIDNPHPPDQMLYIANEGFSTLNWQISLSGNCSWLTVYPTTGQSTGDVNAVTLHADAAGLEAGFYACDLIVSDFYADNNPRIVSVGLYVCPRQGLLIVPTVFGTIQDAVDAAVDGDQVVIVPGTYTGPGNFDIDVGGKEITVRSIAPNNPNTVADTIVDGNSGGPNDGESFGFGFFFMNAEGPNTVLEGLTITGSHWGGGIYLNQTCPTIRKCVIRDNWGNGILGSFSGDLIIEGCTIARNTGGEWGGGGITLYGAGSLTITECLIANNSSYHWGYGGGIRYYWRSQEGPPADINITDCIITGNEGDNGGGLYCEAGSCSITNSEIINNAAYDMGGGVYVFDGNCTIENTTISNNTAEGDGGGLYARYCDTTIADSVISQNHSGQEGGGLFIERCTGTITSSQISNNSATYFGGGLAGFGGPLLLSNCVLSGNEATDGGAIGAYFGPVSNCTIVGNKAVDTTIMVGRMPEPIRNCIIWDNRSEFIVDRILSLEYDCVQGGWDGLGNIELDPCFAVPGYWHPNDTPNDVNDDFWVDGDYHLKSEAGRWKPSIYGGLDSTADNFIDLTDFAAFAGYWQKEGIGLPADLDRSGTADFNDLTLLLENYLASYADGAWVYDNVTSPCIDTGNPGCPLGDEPNDANNVRVNMGAYGGRAEASKTPLDWAILADLDNDIIVDVNDLGVFCDYWLDSGECIPADLDRSGFVDFADYAILSKQWLWPD